MRLVYLIFLFSIISSNLLSSSDSYLYRFTDPSYSNYGGIGSIQNPTARFLNEGSLSFSWSKLDPYLRGSIVAHPFNWLEASFQYTDINNKLYSDVFEFSGNQSFKDKSFDFKVRLLQETSLIPELALGMRDLAGTGNFSSEYIVASKYYKNIDFHLGIGWGVLSGGHKVKNPFIYLSDEFNNRVLDVGQGGTFSTSTYFRGKDAGVFWGMEYFIPSVYLKGARLKVEYDGTNYLAEGPEPLPQDSNINFGIELPISNNFSFKFGYLRGNTLNFGFSLKIDFGKKYPLIPKYDKPIELENPKAIKVVTKSTDRYLYLATLNYTKYDDFGVQAVDYKAKDSNLSVAFAQNKYINHAIALSRLTEILDQIAPESIETFTLTNINAGMQMYTVDIDRAIYNSFKKFGDGESFNQYFQPSSLTKEINKYSYRPPIKLPRFFYSLGPGVRSQIGGPDGFYLGQLSLRLDSELLLAKGFNIDSILQWGLIDSFDELKLASDSVLPHVRTEIVNYLRESRKSNITRMQLNFFRSPKNNHFIKLSAGIFEEMFGGVGFEYLYRPFDKDFAVGFDMYRVQQREYRQLFGFQDYKTTTGHITYYFREPNTNVLAKISGGRYLAKDSGITIDLSRRFKSGFVVGVFASKTDISAEEFGEGSFDKGFYFSIALQDFFTNRRKGRSGFALSPLTRDGAAKLITGYDLWGVTDQASEYNLRFGMDSFYD